MLKNKMNFLPLRATLWLLLLGPGFFALYGSINHFTASLEPVPSIYFSFERSMPVIQWHFVPYLILDIMFAASLFLCKSPQEMDRHAKRLATAIVFSVVCFLLWPLKFSFDRPEMTGLIGEVYRAFIEFDLPYNQAPSLHVSLTVLVGIIFLRHLPKLLFWPIVLWCGLIIISVITTYQHHIIDIITAIPVVFFCLALFPDQAKNYRTPGNHTHRHWVGYLYLALGLNCLLAGGGLRYLSNSSVNSYWSALLAWPAMACGIMAKAYLSKDVGLLHKSLDGRVCCYLSFLLLPITVMQKLYKLSYHKKVDAINEILPNVFIARRLSQKELAHLANIHTVKTVIDVAPEFNAANIEGIDYQPLHWLDLAPVNTEALHDASHKVSQALTNGAVVIECKLGLQRSVLVVLAYLIIEKSMAPEQAFSVVKGKRPGAVLREEQLNELHKLLLTHPYIL